MSYKIGNGITKNIPMILLSGENKQLDNLFYVTEITDLQVSN